MLPYASSTSPSYATSRADFLLLPDLLSILLPIYKWWAVPYYYAGVKVYDLLAGTGEGNIGAYLMGESERASLSPLGLRKLTPLCCPFAGKKKTMEAFPMLKEKGLAGGVVYYDGQFELILRDAAKLEAHPLSIPPQVSTTILV